MIYAILDENGATINTIVADQAFVERHYPERWKELPEEPIVIPSSRILTKTEFVRRLTLSKLVSIEEAAESDFSIRAWLRVFSIAPNELDTTDSLMTDGMALLISKGYLTAEEAAAVLA